MLNGLALSDSILVPKLANGRRQHVYVLQISYSMQLATGRLIYASSKICN